MASQAPVPEAAAGQQATPSRVAARRAPVVRMPGPADSQLVERARQGDRDAFGDLYRRHSPAIWRSARWRLPDGADDVVAETFTRAWESLPRYRDMGKPFVAWLYGIAHHVVADELKRRGREQARELPEQAITGVLDTQLLVSGALERLPDEQRQVIELKFLLGLSNDEVGAALGKSPGAVNAQQWRALRAMRLMIQSDD